MYEGPTHVWRVTTSGQRSRNQTYVMANGVHIFVYIIIVVCVQKFFVAIKIMKKNNQATHYNQHSLAEVVA